MAVAASQFLQVNNFFGLTDTAIVLAGGKSSRLGRDKKTVLIDGKPLIELILQQVSSIFPRVIVVDSSDYDYGRGYEKVGDIITGSALAGLYSGLCCVQCPYAFVVACDMPFINQDYLKYQLNQLKLNPKSGIVTKYEAWGEPLHGFYHRSLAQPMAEYLQRGQKSIYNFVKTQTDCLLVPEAVARGFSPDWRMFFNINTPTELEEYYILRELTELAAN